MKLTNSVIQSFAVGKVWRDNSARINAMDFWEDGELLVTSSDDDTINLYNPSKGTKIKTISSKKYGVDTVRFTHHNNAILFSSRNNYDHAIRYLSLHDNRFLRYFKGHTWSVISLDMSPKSDLFISSALDDTVRLWDLNTNVCQGVMHRKGRSVVAFDPQGLIFGVAAETNLVKLFDVRSYDKGPFSTFQVKWNPIEWSSLKFSPDGNHVLVSTRSSIIFLLDAFSGQVKQSFSLPNPGQSPLDASFSPDGNYVICGSPEGGIHVWETMSASLVTVLKAHPSAVTTAKFNPRTVMIASACSQLAFWIPQANE